MNNVDLSSYSNSWYQPGNKLKILSWVIVSYLFFKTSLPFPSKLKCLLLKLFGAKLGGNIVIKPCVNIKYPWFLSIGDNTWIGESVWIDNLAFVIIGKNCCLSQGAYLLTGNHNYSKSTFDLLISNIKIEDGSWLGAKSIVCPGVTVKSHSILTVSSVATIDLDECGIYQGNPAKKIKQRVIK